MNLLQLTRRSIPLLLIFVLSACGFHLRGIINVPTWLHNVAIISKNNDKQMVSFLQTQLESQNIDVIADPDQADYWLIVDEVHLHQQIISIGSSTNPRQYTLTLTVSFQVQTRKGEIIKTPGRIYVSRQLTLNNDRILGSQDEESILIGEMKQDAVTQILNRLAHVERIIQPN